MIRHLAQRSGIRDGTLRTALSRACSAGSLEAIDGRYRLGPVSHEDAASAKALLSRARGYTLGIVTEGGVGEAPRLRDLFVRFGFRPLQRSVWVGARTKADRLGPALERAGFAAAVTVFHADEVDPEARARLSALWRLDDRADALRRFHRQMRDYLTETGLTAEEAAWRCVEVAPVWYRVVVREEPPFPLDLCGAEYPIDALNRFWRTHVKVMTPALAALWRAYDA